MSEIPNEEELLKSLPQIALKKIRALCRGNGAEADSVQIKSATGRIVSCEALTHLEIDSEFKDESKSGAHQIGQSFQDGATMESEIQNYLSGIIKHGDSRRVMVNQIKKTSGQGFGSHAEYFNMDALNKDYSFQQACGACAGQKLTTCGRCNGQAKERCGTCHGQTMVNCVHCQGSGTTRNAQGGQDQCRQCSGRRQVPCTICRRTGAVPCRGCRGSGQLKCQTCDGAGIFTYVRHVFVKMKTLFEIDRTELPHPAVKVIEDSGAKMVDRGHIQLAQSEQVAREDGGLAIQYLARFPYGDLELSINGKVLRAHLFGFNGKLLKLPKFLEGMLEKNIEHLKSAASHGGQAVHFIKKAARSRLIAQSILFIAMLPRKQAMNSLKKKFPMGVGNQFIKSTVMLSDQALKNATKKTRVMGYILTSVFSCALFALYLTMLRPVLLPFASQDILMLIPDLALIVIVGYVGFVCLGKLINRPLVQALNQILTNKQRATFKPRTQANFWISLGVSAALFLVIAVLSSFTGLINKLFWLPF